VDTGQRTVQEVARARLLDDLGPRVAAQFTEAVVAEDDRTPVHLSVGDDEVAICRRRRSKRKGKGKRYDIVTLDIAPLRESSPQKRSGVARVLKKGSHTVLPAHPHV